MHILCTTRSLYCGAFRYSVTHTHVHVLALWRGAIVLHVSKKPLVIPIYNGTTCVKKCFYIEWVHVCFEGYCLCETTFGQKDKFY